MVKKSKRGIRKQHLAYTFKLTTAATSPKKEARRAKRDVTRRAAIVAVR